MYRRYVEIHDVEPIKSTEKALLCVIQGHEVWVPFSQIAEDSEVSEEYDGPGTLRVTRWWYEVSGTNNLAYEEEVSAPASLKKAPKLYKKLMFEFHPDRNKGDGTTAKALNQLWQAVIEDLKE